jgi:3-phenylpropionate/trans-cinnamate dioxygenase ferredoxin subunit
MTWVTVAARAALQDGEVKVVEVAERRIALCRAEGEYFAIDDLCTHDGGPLDQGRVEDHSIECPRHGARFDIRTGKVLALPAVRPVKAYPTRLTDGFIEVEVP